MNKYSLNLGICLSSLALLVSSFHDDPPVVSVPTSTLPRGFLFGTASSSYQYEGAASSDGKGLSNWDVFTHITGNILDGSNGDVAVDHYHLFLEDIDLMKNLGVNSFRFSISWARILPKGRFGDVNMAGVDHYNRVIDALALKGIVPFVTLVHYDLPQELEETYGSWLSPNIRKDFEHYADVCFKYFGDRVKFWATFNEPNVMAVRGYRSGLYPPSRCSPPFGNCSNGGDSEQEPLVAAHNMILSHAAAAQTYHTKYKKQQGGRIGIVVNAIWYEPFSNSTEDRMAAERAQSFYMNWFLDPIIFGRYPEEMRELLGATLPVFSEEEVENMVDRLGFIGINHYTSFYSKDCMYSDCEVGDPGVSMSEGCSLRTPVRDGQLIGESTAVDWLYVYPQGMEKIVMYIKDRYNNTPMFITENGLGLIRYDLNSPDFRNDSKRVEYMSSYFDSLTIAIRRGADVRGYFPWSLLDNFEWLSGFTIRFGLHHVDTRTLERTPMSSASWYKQLIQASTAFNSPT